MFFGGEGKLFKSPQPLKLCTSTQKRRQNTNGASNAHRHPVISLLNSQSGFLREGSCVCGGGLTGGDSGIHFPRSDFGCGRATLSGTYPDPEQYRQF